MKQQTHNTALYLRLSRDDEGYGDSTSIETQRTILQQYAAEHGLNVVGEYVDDGWSGTNFDRPAFQRMIADIESGKVNCVMTKDLSRFGREHVKMDYYLEFYFPDKRVRYIAVTDNEDTSKGLSDFVPFKNLFNEWYAKDTSRKVKAAFKSKYLSGEQLHSVPALGYKRHPEQKNALVVDEDTRWIVEKIFDLAYHGYGTTRIQAVLRKEKIPVPSYLNHVKYGTHIHDALAQSEEQRYFWRTQTLLNILRNEVYIGNTVHYKTGTASYKNKRRIYNPSEEWMRIENTHEPIIPKEVFDRVQQNTLSRTRTRKCAHGEIHMFAGIIRCAVCGYALTYQNRKDRAPYYRCSHTHALAYGEKAVYVRDDVLSAYVLARIQHWCDTVQLDPQKALDQFMKNGKRSVERDNSRRDADLRKAIRQKAEVDATFVKLYDDWATGRISAYNYDMLSERYQAKQAELDETIQRLQSVLAEAKDDSANAKKWVDLIQQFAHPTELTRELVQALISKIVVHTADTGEDQIRTQKIEIFYNFVGDIDTGTEALL